MPDFRSFHDGLVKEERHQILTLRDGDIEGQIAKSHQFYWFCRLNDIHIHMCVCMIYFWVLFLLASVIKKFLKLCFFFFLNLLGKWILYCQTASREALKTSLNNCKHTENRKQSVKNQSLNQCLKIKWEKLGSSLPYAFWMNSPLKCSLYLLVRLYGR